MSWRRVRALQLRTQLTMLLHQLVEVVLDGNLLKRGLRVIERLTGVVDPATGQRDIRRLEIDPGRRGGLD